LSKQLNVMQTTHLQQPGSHLQFRWAAHQTRHVGVTRKSNAEYYSRIFVFFSDVYFSKYLYFSLYIFSLYINITDNCTVLIFNCNVYYTKKQVICNNCTA